MTVFSTCLPGWPAVLPALPLIGGGKTLFQPVYVGDVADCVLQAIKTKALDNYQLGGPDVLSFKGLLEKMKQHRAVRGAYYPTILYRVGAGILCSFTGRALNAGSGAVIKNR